MLAALNIIITILISIATLIYSNYYTQNFYTIALTSVFVYLMFFISWFIQCKNKINYYTIFLLFTFMFYFGQFFLLLIGVPLESGRTILDGRLPYEALIKTGVFIINYMIILHLGVILSTFNINNYINIDNTIEEKDYLYPMIFDKTFKKVALFLFLISIIPSYIILIKNIQVTFTYGYGAIFQSEYYTSGGINNILRFLSRFTIPSFLMLLILYKDNKKLKIVNIFLIVYLLLYFLGGSRLNGVLLISTLLLIKHYWYNPISNKSMVKIGIFIIVLLVLLNLISAIRNSVYNVNDFSYLLKSTIKQIIISNPLFLAMEEAGYTFLATATVVAYCPSVIPYYNGMSYINSLFMVIPNLLWDVHPAAKVNTDIVFKGFLTKYGGIGSSFIAESYYNMGDLSLLTALLFGVLIGTLSKKIIKYSKEKNTMKFYLYIYIAQFSLFYVRSDTVSFWRNYIYYGMVPLLFVFILSKKCYLKRRTP
jgi:hypothetical protein